MRIHLQALTQVLLTAVLLVSPVIAAKAAATDVVIEDYTLVSKTRVSRFAYQFVYRASAINTGGALADVQATLGSPVPAGMTPIDDVLDLGDMGAGASASAELSFRQDRRFPLHTDDLAWDITGTEAEPRELIPGDPSETVATAIQTIDTNDKYLPAEVSTDSEGRDILRTQLKIVFRPGVTVAEANDLLNRIGATVTNAIAGVPLVVVRIPDPGDLLALDQLIGDLVSDPIVAGVEKAVFPKALVLPDNYSPLDDTNVDYIGHHLAGRAAAAWNAKKAAKHTPHVIIMDYFGDGAPKTAEVPHDFNAADFALLNPANPGLCETAPEDQKPTDCPSDHGYHVLGIMGGKFGGTSAGDESAYVTGLVPGKMKVDVIDLKTTGPLAGHMQLLNRAISAINSMGGDGFVVASTSIGYECDGGANGQTCTSPQQAIKDGAEWARLVRASELEDHLLQATAAGNIEPPFPAAQDAETGSRYSAAALRNDLTHQGQVVPKLTNTLVVENVVGSQDALPVGIDCLAESSFVGGTIGGIGTDVWSFVDSIGNSDELSGTSMATPQVAALAAYMGAIDPDLDPQRAIELITATASNEPVKLPPFPGCSDYATPAHLIDAYAAVLGLDAPEALEPDQTNPDAPVRLAILDVADAGGNEGTNEKFDEYDLQLFLGKVDPSLTPADPDYSRYDLNGDGWTGGNTVDRFNLDINFPLDMNDPPMWDKVYQQLGQLPVAFDEEYLTDLQVLCYYAYSPLYQGDDLALRDELMQPHLADCGAAFKIGFTSDRNGTENCYLMDPDGTTFAVLARSAQADLRKKVLLAKTDGSGHKVAFDPSSVSEHSQVRIEGWSSNSEELALTVWDHSADSDVVSAYTVDASGDQTEHGILGKTGIRFDQQDWLIGGIWSTSESSEYRIVGLDGSGTEVQTSWTTPDYAGYTRTITDDLRRDNDGRYAFGDTITQTATCESNTYYDEELDQEVTETICQKETKATSLHITDLKNVVTYSSPCEPLVGLDDCRALHFDAHLFDETIPFNRSVLSPGIPRAASPSGEYLSVRTGNPQGQFLIKADLTETVDLTEIWQGPTGTTMLWSPLEDAFIYWGDSSGNSEILWRARKDNWTEVNLTKNPAQDRYPVWVPAQ